MRRRQSSLGIISPRKMNGSGMWARMDRSIAALMIMPRRSADRLKTLSVFRATGPGSYLTPGRAGYSSGQSRSRQEPAGLGQMYSCCIPGGDRGSSSAFLLPMLFRVTGRYAEAPCAPGAVNVFQHARQVRSKRILSMGYSAAGTGRSRASIYPVARNGSSGIVRYVPMSAPSAGNLNDAMKNPAGVTRPGYLLAACVRGRALRMSGPGTGSVPEPSSCCGLFCPGFQRFVHLLKTAPGIGIEHP